MDRNELQDLVDRPHETLSAEYKSGLDLTEPRNRANLARHIAALSNYGGGCVVFGFEDDMTPSNPGRAPDTPYTGDMISGICRKYLEPAPQCELQVVTAASGANHPIIVVPPHGATPVCAKVNGPEIDKKIVGVVQGTYYTRKVGPESAAIINVAEWHPIIRRCAMHDRSAILAALNASLSIGTPTPSLVEALRRWHDAARTFYKRDANKLGRPEAALRLVQYSYAIARADDEILELGDLVGIARQVNNEVHDRVQTGWTMFYPFEREPIAPYFTNDANGADEALEFLECRMMREPDRFTDMWRLAPNGMATLIRPFWEDDADTNKHYGWTAGTWLSPFYQYRAIAELVRHAQGMSERFKTPTTVAFRCEWVGLDGRHIDDPFRQWSPGRRANAEGRIASGTWPVSALIENWPAIVAALGAPLIRVFATDLNLGPEFVKRHASEWQKL